MLDSTPLDVKVKKKAYKKAVKPLKLRLAKVQRHLRQAGIPVAIVFEGWDAAGKGSAIGRLMQTFDPRGFKVHHIDLASPLESLFPPMHRFWKVTPEHGAITVFNHSWYRQVINNPIDSGDMADVPEDTYERIRVFERQLAADGAVILKFFLHISQDEQAKRFKKLSKDPAFSWKVGKRERKYHKHYNRYAEYVDRALQKTSSDHAPWHVIPATNRRARDLKIAEIVTEALEGALEDNARQFPTMPEPTLGHHDGALRSVDLSKSIEKGNYKKTLRNLQSELRRLQHLCYVERRAVVLVFEGWDAGGKGGAIRRLTRKLDPRGYEVIPIRAPEGAEKRHHYLWRFWQALRKGGHFTIYDRSWYGRVMVERVEGFATPEEWQRAYQEINEFESDLVHHGIILCKFWLHISKEEQLNRFEARMNNPEKQWKITEEDWRNREKWDLYWDAVCDMIALNSPPDAPWTVVAGEDKRHARIQVLSVVVERIRAALSSSEAAEPSPEK